MIYEKQKILSELVGAIHESPEIEYERKNGHITGKTSMMCPFVLYRIIYGNALFCD